MALQIINKDRLGENDLLPYAGGVRRGLLSRKLFNTSLEKCARNFAPGQPDDTIVGEPVLGEGFVTCKALDSFFQTQILEPMGGSILIGVRTRDTLEDFDHRPVYIGTNDSAPRLDAGANISGVTMRHASSASTIVGQASRSVDGTRAEYVNGAQSLAWADPSVWEMFWLLFPAGAEQNTVINATAETSATTTIDPVAPRFPTVSTLRWGSGYSNNRGESDLAFGMLWNVILDSDERAEEEAIWRAYQLDRYGRTF